METKKLNIRALWDPLSSLTGGRESEILSTVVFVLFRLSAYSIIAEGERMIAHMCLVYLTTCADFSP